MNKKRTQFKVAYILDSFPNTSETFISDEILSVMELGIEVVIFSLNRPKSNVQHLRISEILKETKIIYLSQQSKKNKLKALCQRLLLHRFKTTTVLMKLMHNGQESWKSSNAFSYASLIENEGVDHIHAHYADVASQTAMVISSMTGLPYTFTTHGYDVFVSPPLNYRNLVLNSKKMICISEFNKNYLMTKYDLPTSKIEVVHCGIYVNDYIKHNKKQISTKGQSVKILTVARLLKIKGHSYLFKALKRLFDEGKISKRFTLTLAGDGPEYESLVKQANKYGFENNIKFLGFQTQDQVAKLLAQCDFFVLPSLSEGIPISLMEAMASNKLVIAPNVNGVSELVVDNETGFLFQPGNSKDLGDIIGKVIRSPDGFSEITTAATEKIRQNFSRIENSKKLISLWRASK
jgi:glycosyltransferase involved in cell wall biosynthesis